MLKLARHLLPLLLFLSTGCYSAGYQPAAGLKELAVPLFRNDTLRREVGVDLTRRLRERILEQTPLHLASEADAGAVLRGRVNRVLESVLVAGPAEEVLASSVVIEVSFGVYERGRLLIGDDSDGDGVPDEELVVQGMAEFNSALGEDRGTATREALRDVAELIILRLQDRWDDRLEPNDGPEQASPLQPGRQVALRQRNPDWFRIRIPPKNALRATLFFSQGSLRMRPLSFRGGVEALRGAELRDEGRVLHAVAGAGGLDALLEVTGDDSGARYQLLVESRPDDRAEPDSSPDDARVLEGEGPWRLRGLQRDDDFIRVPVPAGRRLVVELTAPAPLKVGAFDDQGGPRRDVRPEGGRLIVDPAAEATNVLLGVTGDDAGHAYDVSLELR